MQITQAFFYYMCIFIIQFKKKKTEPELNQLIHLLSIVLIFLISNYSYK